MSEWQKVTPKEFRDAGLLYAVNEIVLWPIGYAIGVDPTSEDPDGPLHLMRLLSGEVIVEGEFDVTKEPEKTHPMLRFVSFAKARIEEMPEEDQRLAREQLNKILGPDVV